MEAKHTYTFEGQHAHEEVVLLLRQHIVTLLPRSLVGFGLFLLPSVVVLVPLNAVFPGVSIGRYLLVLGALWYLFSFSYLFEQFLSWYYNVYIATNERIIDIDFRGLLSSDLSEAPLRKLEDVTSRTIGFFPLLFGYGDVIIQTAAEVGQFEFERVPNPERVAREISQLMRTAPRGGAPHE